MSVINGSIQALRYLPVILMNNGIELLTMHRWGLMGPESPWAWEKCKDKILSLRGRKGFPDADVLSFLRISVSLSDGKVMDEFTGVQLKRRWKKVVYALLYYYSSSPDVKEAGRFVDFRKLPGGYAFAKAFSHRVIQPLVDMLKENPEHVREAMMALGGEAMPYGDFSFKVRTLPHIPVLLVFWVADDEFPAHATMLFDENVTQHIPTEMVAILGELLRKRIWDVRKIIETLPGAEVFRL